MRVLGILVALAFSFSTFAAVYPGGNLTSDWLNCAFSLRLFSQQTDLYSQKYEGLKNRDGRVYVMSAMETTLPRTVAIVLDSGIFKVTYGDEQVQSAIARRQDYVQLKITGTSYGDFYVSVHDEQAIRDNRKNGKYALGSPVFFGTEKPEDHASFEAEPANSYETSIITQNMIASMAKRLTAMRATIDGNNGENRRSLDSLNREILNQTNKITQMRTEKLNAEHGLVTVTESVEKFGRLLAAETNKDLREALQAKLTELTAEQYQQSSQVYDLSEAIKQAEQKVDELKAGIERVSESLTVGSGRSQKLRDLFQANVGNVCKLVPGLE